MLAWLRKHDEAGAQKTLEAVIAVNPLYESATALLAKIYHRHGRDADAEYLVNSYKEQHSAADPSVQWSMRVGNQSYDPVPHKELGKIHLKRGKIARAIVELKETLRLRPGDPEAQSLLKSALNQRGTLPFTP